MSLETWVKEDTESMITDEVPIKEEASEDDLGAVAGILIEAAIVDVDFTEPLVKEECIDSELSKTGLNTMVLPKLINPESVKQESPCLDSIATVAVPCAGNAKDKLVLKQTHVQQIKTIRPPSLHFHMNKTVSPNNLNIVRLKIDHKFQHLTPRIEKPKKEQPKTLVLVEEAYNCKKCNKPTHVTDRFCHKCEKEQARELLKSLKYTPRFLPRTPRVKRKHRQSIDNIEHLKDKEVNLAGKNYSYSMRECSVRLERCDAAEEALQQLLYHEAVKIYFISKPYTRERNNVLIKYKGNKSEECIICKKPTVNNFQLCQPCEQERASRILSNLSRQSRLRKDK